MGAGDLARDDSKATVGSTFIDKVPIREGMDLMHFILPFPQELRAGFCERRAGDHGRSVAR